MGAPAVNYVGQYVAGGTRMYFVPGHQREVFRAQGGLVRRQATSEETAVAQANGATYRILPLDLILARGRTAQLSSAPALVSESSPSSELEPEAEGSLDSKKGKKRRGGT